jgi:D-tyrosyl-tRNA(Tyr) deacylase
LRQKCATSGLLWGRRQSVIALIQRVGEASVSVAGARIAAIGAGMLVLVAVERGDAAADIERMAERLLHFRLFPDAAGRMNRNIGEVGGELLLVPQFTLAADTDSGHRPSFSGAAPPDAARAGFEALIDCLARHGMQAATGRFGADMQVALVNDGPVTFRLRTHQSGRVL